MLTGKHSLGEEISQLALSSAQHMLEFSHRSRPQLVPDCVEVGLHSAFDSRAVSSVYIYIVYTRMLYIQYIYGAVVGRYGGAVG